MTAKFDFSHLMPSAMDSAVRQIERGLPITDELLLAAFRSIRPSPLPLRDRQAVVAILKHRRGRRRGPHRSRIELARRVELIDHQGVPASFQAVLADRILAILGLTEKMQQRRRRDEAAKRDRNWFIKVATRDVQKLLDKQPFVEHPILGKMRVAVSETAMRKSEIAAATVADYMRSEYGDKPPGVRRMLNIATEK